MNRYAVRIGSVAALALSAALFAIAPALAAESLTYAYNGKRIVFQILRESAGPAVAADDPGLRSLVNAAGGTLTWDSDNQYVLITYPGPKVISFAVGDAHYLSGSVSHAASFAPFLRDGHAYVPLNDVLRAMNLPAAPGARGAVPAAEPSPQESIVPSPLPLGATPMPSPSATAAAQVTAVDVEPQSDGVFIRIAVTGSGSYDWHRLRPPDNRWWVDVHGAKLAMAPVDETHDAPVTAVRVHQQNSDTVRVALSLADFQRVDVVPDGDGLTITVSNTVVADAARAGSGTFGAIAMASATPAPSPNATATQYVPTNPKLIAIDPGHGGSDPGAARSGTQEKTLTLDVAMRLRDLLRARGWQVVMTRETDKDVYQPNDSARDELQARDDVANSKGARLLVSIHVNSYVNAGPHGVTTFYYKQSDLALAQAINRRVVSELGIKSNGVVKDKLYVVNHAAMPAALVETAFISNPDDLALLQSNSWRQKMAQAIADGIADYVSSN